MMLFLLSCLCGKIFVCSSLLRENVISSCLFGESSVSSNLLSEDIALSRLFGESSVSSSLLSKDVVSSRLFGESDVHSGLLRKGFVFSRLFGESGVHSGRLRKGFVFSRLFGGNSVLSGLVVQFFSRLCLCGAIGVVLVRLYGGLLILDGACLSGKVLLARGAKFDWLLRRSASLSISDLLGYRGRHWVFFHSQKWIFDRWLVSWLTPSYTWPSCVVASAWLALWLAHSRFVSNFNSDRSPTLGATWYTNACAAKCSKGVGGENAI